MSKTDASLSNSMQFWGHWRFMQIRQRIFNRSNMQIMHFILDKILKHVTYCICAMVSWRWQVIICVSEYRAYTQRLSCKYYHISQHLTLVLQHQQNNISGVCETKTTLSHRDTVEQPPPNHNPHQGSKWGKRSTGMDLFLTSRLSLPAPFCPFPFPSPSS